MIKGHEYYTGGARYLVLGSINNHKPQGKRIMKDEFYLQDSRNYVGNDVLFWRDGGGYTTNVNEAEVFTKEKAFGQYKCRETDLPWPKGYIDGKTRPAVDMQYLDREVALQDI